MSAESRPKDLSERYSFLMPIIIGTVMIFMALMLIGITYRIFPGHQTVHWPARVAAAIFGAILIGTGFPILNKGIRAAMNKAGIRHGSMPRRLLVFYRRRISWRSILAGLPYLILSVQFYYYWQQGRPWPPDSGEELKNLYLVEFSLIHSTLFMGAIALLPLSGTARVIKYILILMLGIFYSFIAAAHLTLYGLLSFLFLIVSKYSGYYLTPPSTGRKLSLFLRWGVQFLTFILVCAATGNSNLSGFRNVVSSFWYFLCLGIFEGLNLFSVAPDEPLPQKK